MLYIFGPTAKDRSWVAFGQHFTLNYQQFHQLPGEPWSEWERFVAQEFPTSQSVVAAAQENPQAFIWHLSYNGLRRLPGGIIMAVLPTVLHADSAAKNVLLGGPIVVGLIGLAVLGRWKGPPLHRSARPLLALSVIPLASLLVMPKARHLLPWVPLLGVLAAWGLQWLLTQPPPWRSLAAVLAGGLLLIGTVGTLVHFLPGFADTQPSMRTAIGVLRQEATQEQPVRLLTAFGGERICALVGSDRCVPLTWTASDVPSAYATRHEPNWILVSPDWNQRTIIQNDPPMRAFLAAPEPFGCHAELVTQRGVALLRCTPAFQLP
jgi:hypothetical protein